MLPFRRLFQRRNVLTDKQVVVITGCDSGLGFNFAKKCQELKLLVIAGCLSSKSKGASKLLELNQSTKGQPIIVQDLDLTQDESIDQMGSLVQKVIGSDESRELYGIVNNAACMIFGEFEWLTSDLIARQLGVNLFGTIKLTHRLLPIMRSQLNGRVINITSHCGQVALPGLSVYAASKAGNTFWTDALRIELRKYNINVVNFIPGSFIFQSNILANQHNYKESMWDGLDLEQKQFYGEYFSKYNDFLIGLQQFASDGTESVQEPIMDKFEDAILSTNPKFFYKIEPLKYKFFHTLFKILPQSKLRDDLIEKFMAMPKYK